MAVVPLNITVNPDVLKRFQAIAEERGMKISPWVNAQMKKFVEEEEARMGKSKKKE